MTKLFTITFITISVFVTACSSSKKMTAKGIPKYQPESKELHDAIARMDSLFFDAYNTCKVDLLASLISEDVEFYHDRGGLSTSKKELVEATRNNICNKVKRELLKASVEVYPIPKYGAVQMGAHRFHNLIEKSTSAYSKFVHTWHNENGQWKLARVISLH